MFELKYDGFRALALIDGQRCTLVSRRGHVFARWGVLCTEIKIENPTYSQRKTTRVVRASTPSYEPRSPFKRPFLAIH